MEWTEADEADLAAFEQELAAIPPPKPSAVIEAAPMTTQEIAELERKDRGARMRQMEEDAAGAEEDFQNRLQDEFEKMESLEDRLRKLREKREALREYAAHMQKPEDVSTESTAVSAEQEDEDSESDEDDTWDVWRFQRA
jgi:hypothetical protein